MREIVFFRTRAGDCPVENKMNDLGKYIAKRETLDPEFALDFDSGYEEFKLGIMLKQARELAGLTQDELAAKMGTKKSAVSRMENHAEDVKLSTLGRFARALGKRVYLKVS